MARPPNPKHHFRWLLAIGGLLLIVTAALCLALGRNPAYTIPAGLLGGHLLEREGAKSFGATRRPPTWGKN